jgi:hypothetical protein|tara:strand:+ start:2195 stop:2500 length:306 start_codon:yes stop_codon:yes gene_type:complete
LGDVTDVKATLSRARAILKEKGKVYVIGDPSKGRRRRVDRGHLLKWFGWTGFELLKRPATAPDGRIHLVGGRDASFDDKPRPEPDRRNADVAGDDGEGDPS